MAERQGDVMIRSAREEVALLSAMLLLTMLALGILIAVWAMGSDHWRVIRQVVVVRQVVTLEPDPSTAPEDLVDQQLWERHPIGWKSRTERMAVRPRHPKTWRT